MPEKSETPKFTDSEGRDWLLSFNLGIVRDLKETVGFDFGELQEGSAFTKMATDPGKLASVLWMLCEKQADKRKVDEEAFACSIDADALESAGEGLVGAIINFSQPHLRPAVKEVFEQVEKAQAAGAEALREWAKSENIEEEVGKMVTEKLGTFGDLLQS